MAPARRVAEPLRAKLACVDLLWLIEDWAWTLWKKWYTGPSRADRWPGSPYLTLNARREVLTTLSYLHLLQAKTGLRSDQMAPRERDEPFGDWS